MPENFVGQLQTELILEDIIGEGGMGVVYRASLESEKGFARQVAAKKLKKPSTDQLDRFLREAKLAAQLHHPNISSVFDIRENDGDLYLISDLIEGNSLREIIHAKNALGEPFSEGAVIYIIRSILNALSYAHHRDILHLDISPSNIMIDRFGIPKLIDFGISESRTMSSAEHSAVVMGQARYIAPERLAPTPMNLPQADIFSLGAIAVELLGGEMIMRDADDLHKSLQGIAISETVATLKVKGNKIRNIVGQLIDPDFDKRPTADNLIKEFDSLEYDSQAATAELQAMFVGLNNSARPLSETKTVALSGSLIESKKRSRIIKRITFLWVFIILLLAATALWTRKSQSGSESLFGTRIMTDGGTTDPTEIGLSSERLSSNQLPIFTCDSLFQNVLSFPTMLFNPRGRASFLNGDTKRSFYTGAFEIVRMENARLNRVKFIFENCKHMPNAEKVRLLYFSSLQLLDEVIKNKLDRVEDLYALKKINETALEVLNGEAFPEFFVGYYKEVNRLKLDKIATTAIDGTEQQVKQIKLPMDEYPSNAKDCLYKLDAIWGHRYVYWNYPEMAPSDTVKIILTPDETDIRIDSQNSNQLTLNAKNTPALSKQGFCEYIRVGTLAKVNFWAPASK